MSACVCVRACQMLLEVVAKTLKHHGIGAEHGCFQACSRRLFDISKFYLKVSPAHVRTHARPHAPSSTALFAWGPQQARAAVFCATTCCVLSRFLRSDAIASFRDAVWLLFMWLLPRQRSTSLTPRRLVIGRLNINSGRVLPIPDCYYL